jgi:Type I phosphodiesterase / nucleotide pyrophosphatase
MADEVWRRRSVRRTDRPALLVVQIDGLSLPALRHAIQEGLAPFMAGLLAIGQATVAAWEPMLPPTTPASQAGILHGRSVDIPGFRWYQKREHRLLVANHPVDASEILARLSDGHGLLAGGGTSIGNLLTGDAKRSYLTMATVAEEPRAPGTLIRLRTFFVSPLNGIRIAVGMASQFVKELYQGWRQEQENVRPRMKRGLDSALERAFLNSMVRNLSTELVIAEMRLGTPIIYVDYTGYDAIGHHSGPERPESLHAVLGIDRSIERVMAASSLAARPYRLVVLSDHGQSLGAPFAERYGQRLDQFVAAGMGSDASSIQAEDAEHAHALPLLMREVSGALGLARVVERGVAAAVGLASRVQRSDDQDEPDLVVCASGNLAHLYFTTSPNRMTRDEIERRYPGIVAHLLGHPAIALLLVRDETGHPVVLGRSGRRDLRSGGVDGEDPLTPFGSGAAASLARLDTFTNTGDIVLISRMDPDTHEVTSFEPLVGCHGGMGGAQGEPFILYPSDWPLGTDTIRGADAVHDILRSWLNALGL